MISNESELRSKGNQAKAIGIAVVTSLVGNTIFYFLCRDHFMAFVCSSGLGFGVYAWLIAGAITEPGVMRPPAKLYNITPLYTMREIQDALRGQYFGDRKWNLEEQNQEKMNLGYVFKYAKELDFSVPGQKPQKDEILVKLLIQIERVGEGASVELVYMPVSGTLDLVVQEILKQTTGLIDSALKAFEATKQSES